MLFGVLATGAAVKPVQTMIFSAMVSAGTAQFTALQLMQDDAPTLIAAASALAGARIPDALALDFTLPIAFPAMIAPILRTPAHLVSAGVATVISLPVSGFRIFPASLSPWPLRHPR